jgi:hypothetical protein
VTQKKKNWIAFAMFLGPVLTATILFFKLSQKAQYELIRIFGSAFWDTLPISIVICLISLLFAYFDSRKPKPPTCPTCGHELPEDKKHLAVKTEAS